MAINLQQEVQIDIKKVVLGILLLPIILMFISYILGEKLHWCTGMFPDTIATCANAPFLPHIFSTIYSLFPLFFLINIIAVPIAVVLGAIIAIRSRSLVAIVVLLIIISSVLYVLFPFFK